MAHPLAAEYHLTAYFAAYLSEYIKQMSIIVMWRIEVDTKGLAFWKKSNVINLSKRLNAEKECSVLFSHPPNHQGAFREG